MGFSARDNNPLQAQVHQAHKSTRLILIKCAIVCCARNKRKKKSFQRVNDIFISSPMTVKQQEGIENEHIKLCRMSFYANFLLCAMCLDISGDFY